MPRAYSNDVRTIAMEKVQAGDSVEKIVLDLGVSSRTIKRWKKSIEEGGDLSNKYKYCGRKTDEVLENEIVLASVEDPFKSCRKIAEDLEKPISISSVSRLLRKNGLNSCHAARKPKLRDNHRDNRVCFSVLYENFDWERTIFDDESCFSSEKRGIKLVRRPKNTRYDHNYMNLTSHCERKTVSVWGAISSRGFSELANVGSRVNQFVYVELLDTYGVEFIKRSFGREKCFWVSDNCPAHNSHLVKEWFEFCNEFHDINVERISLPPYSPDLNLIENIWGSLKFDLLYENIEATSQGQLWEMIRTKWTERSSNDQIRENLFISMKSRLGSVITSDGFPTRF